MRVALRQPLAAASLALLLVFAGCGAATDDADTDDTSVDQSAEGDTDTTDDSDGDSSDTDDSADDTDDAAEGPAGGAVYTDPTADAVQVAIGENGFDPSSIDVAVGGVVTFTPSDSGPHGIYVGDLDGYSAMGGLTASFRFDQPGTYRVFDEITEAEATVTVQ